MKSFFMRKMLQSKMKDVPADQQEKIFTAIEKNPQLFQTIAQEVDQKMKSGKDQMTAAMEVMTKYQSQLKDIM